MLFSVGCGESMEHVGREKIRIKNGLIGNFKKNRRSFEDLKFYFRLNHIRDIEFHNDGVVSIAYKTGGSINNSKWVVLRRKNIGSDEVSNLLNLDSLKTNNLLQLKIKLRQINVDRLTIIDTYDIEKDKLARAIDLRYKIETNALIFYYRIFREQIYSVPVDFYEQPTKNNLAGGILSDTAIWYYK